jgi:asparagine synthase (glutamine-hydrolysing)
MCGIVGVHRLDGRPVAPELLRAMSRQLIHRGPDGSGEWCDGPTGFGHRRLSIIDLGGSAQPMSSVDDQLHLTFNGEVLNYRDLRAQLSYPFRTAGDTEVILAAYSRWGTAAFSRLRGQFAFALRDDTTGDVHLVRDRLGVLPLYWYADDRMVAFASEIKALLPAVPDISVDLDSVGDYLAHRSVPAPHTLYRGIRKLRPGHRLLIDRAGRVRELPWFELPAGPVPSPVKTAADAVDAVETALRESVDEALVADVPVGAYLSGGVDSSLIVALMSEARAGQGVSTYAAGFGDPRVDELGWARQVAGLLGTDHHEVTVDAADFSELLPRLTWHRDGPLSEPADVAVFRLAELARRDVRVVLSGEGSDELFGGYPKHRAAALAAAVGRVPSAIRGPLAGALARHLPAPAARLAVALRAVSATGEAEQRRSWFAPFSPAERSLLVGDRVLRPAPPEYSRGKGDPLRRMLYADSHTWLSDNLLERGDRMSMAASLELRPPFLDAGVVDLAFSLPSDVKVRRGVGKWVVKEVARRHLPDEIVDRRKSGFRVPLDAWFRTGLRGMAEDLLTGPSSFVSDVLDRSAVTALLSAHAAGERDHAVRIWTLLGLEIWHRGAFGAARLPADELVQRNYVE